MNYCLFTEYYFISTCLPIARCCDLKRKEIQGKFPMENSNFKKNFPRAGPRRQSSIPSLCKPHFPYRLVTIVLLNSKALEVFPSVNVFSSWKIPEIPENTYLYYSFIILLIGIYLYYYLLFYLLVFIY